MLSLLFVFCFSFSLFPTDNNDLSLKKNTKISHLNNDNCFEITRFLPKKDRVNFLASCKKFNNMSKDTRSFWNSSSVKLKMNNYDKSHKESNVISICNHFTNIKGEINIPKNIRINFDSGNKHKSINDYQSNNLSMLSKFLKFLPIGSKYNIHLNISMDSINLGNISVKYLIKNMEKLYNVSVMSLNISRKRLIRLHEIYLITYSFKRIKSINFSNSTFEFDAINVFVKNMKGKNNVKFINLSNASPCFRKPNIITKLISPLNSLEEVIFSKNNIGDEINSIKILSNNLSALPNLKKIDLSINKISDEGVGILFEKLKNCKKIREINLSSNKLTSKSISVIGEYIRFYKNLVLIDLKNNKQMIKVIKIKFKKPKVLI